ncbi:putative protease [Pseudomonas aeruginosa]|nr:putative protease [Pseudomonas aeruginosa]
MPRRPACSATWTYSEETPDATAAAFRGARRDLRRQLAEGEDFTLWYSAEDSEFIRFNRARVRQAGRVRQATTLLRLIRDERQASLDLTLSGIPEEDRQRLGDGLRQLRRSLAWIPPIPTCCWTPPPGSASTKASASLPTAASCWPGSSARRATSTWSVSTPPGRCSAASPTPGGRSAGMPAAASTSTGACSTPTARRSRPTTPASTGMANASPGASSRRANSLATWASRCAS